MERANSASRKGVSFTKSALSHLSMFHEIGEVVCVSL
jgi:hypothetical protein